MKLYGLKNCDSCRAALKALRAQGHEVLFIDVRTDTPSAETLRFWHQRLGEKLLNRRSRTWKELRDTERAQEPIGLMLTHPSLLKRPIITLGDHVSCGWDAKVEAELAANIL